MIIWDCRFRCRLFVVDYLWIICRLFEIIEEWIIWDYLSLDYLDYLDYLEF